MKITRMTLSQTEKIIETLHPVEVAVHPSNGHMLDEAPRVRRAVQILDPNEAIIDAAVAVVATPAWTVATEKHLHPRKEGPVLPAGPPPL